MSPLGIKDGKRMLAASPRPLAIATVLMMCILPLLPMANAATVLIRTDPSDGQIVSGTFTVKAKIDVKPITMSVHIDGIYYSDMFLKNNDGWYWYYTFPLNTFGLTDGPHFIRIEAKGTVDTVSNGTTFFVDNFPPTVTGLNVQFPQGEKAAKNGDRLVVTANVTDTISGVDKVTADLSKLQTNDNGQMYDDGQHNDSMGNDMEYGTRSFVTSALTNGYNIVRVTAYDRMGNQRTVSMGVPMDNHPPNIKDPVVVYPTGQKAVKLGDQVRVVSKVEDKGEGGLLRVGTDLVLVLDNSGSMIHGSNPPMDKLKDAVYNIVNMSHPEDRIAIYAFGTNAPDANRPALYEDAEQYLPFTTMDLSGKQKVQDLLDSHYNNFNYAHNTPIWDTIGEAINYAVTDSERTPVVVAMTDGTDYGYDWYERPDPSWWQSASSMGYYGLGFERGSENYCPWNDWGTTVKYKTHYGEYPAPWPNDPEVHSFDAPIDDTVGFDYHQSGQTEQWDFASGLRAGLLNASVPVFTVGLGLPHHDPITSNTTEYDLYSIATTSNNTKVQGKYYYAPGAGDLASIYDEISVFINLAGDINVTPPGGVSALTLDGTNLGVPIKKPLYDDGGHDDIFKDDETFGTNLFDVNTRVTDVVNVSLDAVNIANIGNNRIVPILVDNTPPVIWGLKAHVLDRVTLDPINRSFAKDGDLIYFTVNSTDTGKVAGLTKVVLDATPLGGDPELMLTKNGPGDDVFTSPRIDVKSGAIDGYINLTATAYDIANNKASTTEPVWVLNGPAVAGQIVYPLDGSNVTGLVTVRVVVSNDTNLLGANLIIAPAANGGPAAQKVMLLMAHGNERDAYTVPWNTKALPDGLYELSCEIGHKGGITLLCPTIVVLVDNTPPVVKIQVPKNGDIITNRTDLMALVYDSPRTYVAGTNLTSVTYVLDGNGSSPMAIFGGLDVNGPHFSLGIDPAALQDGEHKVIVIAVDRVGLTSMDNVTFFTDTLPPKLDAVNVPSTKTNTSGTFLFSFKVYDANGISGGELRFDNGTKDAQSFPFYRNTTSGLWEFSLDTTRLKNGNHTYCAYFQDKASRTTKYCSKFVVSNTAPPIKPHTTHVVEIPWWLLVILVIIIVCLVFTTGTLAREWYLKRSGRLEDEEEMVEKATKRAHREMDEEEVPILPGPKMDELDEAPEVPKEPPVELPPLLEPAEKKVPRAVRVRRTKERMEVSHIAPVAVSGPVKAVLDEAPKKASRKVIKCPMCMFKIPVETDERPLVLTCPKCGAKGQLK
jgi:hypothetical protein